MGVNFVVIIRWNGKYIKFGKILICHVKLMNRQKHGFYFTKIYVCETNFDHNFGMEESSFYIKYEYDLLGGRRIGRPDV